MGNIFLQLFVIVLGRFCLLLGDFAEESLILGADPWSAFVKIAIMNSKVVF